MRRILKSLLIVLIFALVSGAVFAVWQKENIRSVINAIRYNDEEIERKIEDNKKKVEQLVEDITESKIRDFTLEEEEKIRKGEITVEEAIEKVMAEGKTGVSTSENETEANNTQDNSPLTSEPKNKSDLVKDIINDHITQMYHLKASYIGKLGELERRAISDYKSLPPEKRKTAEKQSMLSKYLGEAASLEKECDARVNEVLSGLRSELKSRDYDLEIINTIKKVYEDEKVLRKSYYINMYK